MTAERLVLICATSHSTPDSLHPTTGLMSEYIQANTNGKLHDANEPSISPLDRGFLYGDSVYEVLRTYDGVLFAFEEHFDRLNRSAAALGIEIPFDGGVLITEMRRTISAFFEKTRERTEIYIRLQISRGAGTIGLDTALADRPLYVLIVQRLPRWSDDKLKKGIKLSIANRLCRNSPQNLNPAWKTGNYLNNLMCLREARLRLADEVVILNMEGAIAEASVCNLFFVKGRKLMTPPADTGILEGITRKIVLREALRSWDLDIAEQRIYPDQLDEFDECFLTSTTNDVVPVARIDDIAFKVGKKTLTSTVKKMFAEYVEKHNGSEIEMKVF